MSAATSTPTTTDPVTRVWCPEWCTVSEQDHLDGRHQLEGDVVHTSVDYGEISDEQYALTMIATPEGTPTPDLGQADTMCIAGNGYVYGPDVMERHAYALLQMVARARAPQQERER